LFVKAACSTTLIVFNRVLFLIVALSNKSPVLTITLGLSFLGFNKETNKEKT